MHQIHVLILVLMARLLRCLMVAIMHMCAFGAVNLSPWLWTSITSSTTFIHAHPPCMFGGTIIVYASSFSASPLNIAPCSSKSRVFTSYCGLYTRVWYAKSR